MARKRKRYVIHGADEMPAIRAAAQATAQALDRACRAVRPGMSTLELDRLAAEFIAEEGGRSAFYRYRDFPGQICISLNDEVVHGIGRADRIIEFGDLVSLDCGVNLNGGVGDTARTVCVGPPNETDARLMAVTRESLMLGIAAAQAGNTVYDIGAAVESHVRAAGFSVVREFVGHGVGGALHEPPEVPNYARRQSRSDILRPGMVLAIEPMVNAGSGRVKVDRADHWTVRTADGSRSAHFEHMILITESEPEILTWPKTT